MTAAAGAAPATSQASFIRPYMKRNASFSASSVTSTDSTPSSRQTWTQFAPAYGPLRPSAIDFASTVTGFPAFRLSCRAGERSGSTAITRAKELIDRQRTTLGSHERIGVFRIFGRDAGFSALFAAYVTSARCVLPEVAYDLDRLAAEHGVKAMFTAPTAYRAIKRDDPDGALMKGHDLSGLETVFLPGEPSLAHVSSSLVKEVARYGGEHNKLRI